MKPRELELLAPAANREIARQAILHGADALYMGGPSHGARKRASNSIDDIRETVEFAHQYRARVYVTVNTIVYDHELSQVEKLCKDLYRAGVDALIVQDMSLLRLDIPPIALHASTQCDTRTPAKARFLQDMGFSQIVLARELSIEEIKKVYEAVQVPLECFVHGALCVSYSGRCGASCLATNRSANRGECSQMCRMPYTLRNGRGDILQKDRYLLSLRDFNASSRLREMIEAGASSFKIEGRLKDVDYVKNVTAFYRQAIDAVIESSDGRYLRSSHGESHVSFTPQLDKSFNRGFTDYFLGGRKPVSMASLRTPKSMGETVSDVNALNNGDGISFFNAAGEYEGVAVNSIEAGKIKGSRRFQLPKGAEIHRTYDVRWQAMLAKETAERTLWVDMEIDGNGVTARDERGVEVRLPLGCDVAMARKPMDFRSHFDKLGTTIYRLRNFTDRLGPDIFIPASQLAALRRRVVAALDSANKLNYKFDYRRPETPVCYPAASLDERDNVANSLARRFYEDHGVKEIKEAYEVKAPNDRDVPVMTTRYCLRRELGCCLRDGNVPRDVREKYCGPLVISTGPHDYRLDFDCAKCEMSLIALAKK